MDNFINTLGDTFYDKSGSVDNSSLKSVKLIGVYFSAHWCPPCRNFTPVLANFYNTVNKNGKVFEVVFSSCDKDEKSFKEYLASMPWIALPLGSEVSNKLSGAYQVSGIPRLVILDPKGNIVNSNARNDVASGVDCFNNWLNPESWKPAGRLCDMIGTWYMYKGQSNPVKGDRIICTITTTN